MYGPELEELRKELADKKAARLSFSKYMDKQKKDFDCLDFGCGSSRQIFDLADRFPEGMVFGVDFDLEPLKIAAKIARQLDYKNLFLIQYGSGELPFKNDIFGIVTSHQVLEHIPNPEKSVFEIHRVMQKWGIFEVDFPNGGSIGEIGRSIFHRIIGTKNPHISRIGLNRAKKLFADSGFRIEKFKSVLAVTGPVSYLIEGFFFRYLMNRYKIWEARRKYQSNFIFRFLRKIDYKLGKYFPRLGHAFEFILRKI